MADGLFLEPVHGGLVTSRDPSMLAPGEMQQTDNAVYKPYSLGIHKAPGKTDFILSSGTVSGSSAVTGLKYCAFDFKTVKCVLDKTTTTVTPFGTDTFANISVNARVFGTGIPDGTTISTYSSSVSVILSSAPTVSGTFDIIFDADDLLVAQCNAAYRTAKATTTATAATFTSVDTITEGTTLEAVHYANRHYLLNGKNSNRVLLSGGTVRQHGMEPTTDPPTLTHTASGGTWSLTTGVGYYSYWITEYDQANGLESTFTGKPNVVQVTTTSSYVTIVPPTNLTNTNTTHWKLYRSNKMNATTDSGANIEVVFPYGYWIGTFPIATLTITDGLTTAANTAGTASSVGTNDGWLTSTSATGAADAAFATRADTGLYVTGFYKFKRMSLRFGAFSGITGTVTGITIAVKAKYTGGSLGGLVVRPMPLTALSDNFFLNQKINSIRENIQFKPVPLTTTNTVYTLGSSSDKWGYHGLGSVWTANDFAASGFEVQLDASADGTRVISVDSVTVTVYHGAAQQEGTADPFAKIVVSAYGVTQATGRNGPPPKSSTGDIFQDSLCLNDMTDESLMRYSFPTLADVFPPQYYINFETKDQDAITNIKTVGNVMIIGLKSQIYRCNFLPREQDAEFDRGRAIELIEASHGIVGTHAATLFSGPDGSSMLAYVSRYGLHVTDGYRVKWATMDLDWTKFVDPAYLSKVVLLNNPELYELQMYYVPIDPASGYTTYPIKMLRFSYHPSHIKEGGFLKISGPVDRSATASKVSSACVAVLSDGSRPMYTGSENGHVYIENSTSTDSTQQMALRTREIYQTGFGGEWRWNDLYTHTTIGTAAVGAQTMSTQLMINKTGGTERTTTAKTYSLATLTSSSAEPRRRDINVVVNNQTGEGMSALITGPANAGRMSVDYLVIGWEDQQGEDS